MQLRSGSLVGSPFPAGLPPSPKRKASHSLPPAAKRRRLLSPAQNHISTFQSPQDQTQLRSFIFPQTSPPHSYSAKRPSCPSKDEAANGQATKAALTKKNLKIFLRQTMTRSRKTLSNSTQSGTPTSRITATDKAFGDQLKINGVISVEAEAEEPADLASMQGYINKARRSESPEEKVFRNYRKEVSLSENEDEVKASTWPILSKLPDAPGYSYSLDLQWTEVESPLSTNICDPKPDRAEGFLKSEYPVSARENLGAALAPTQYKLAMPRLCVEFKGPDGKLQVAKKQCAYDGAIMVEAACEIQKYMNKDLADLFDTTQALTMAITEENVHIYANHVVKKGSSLEYHQYPLCKKVPTDSFANFKETCKMIRNAQDWAQERAAKTKDELHAFVHAGDVGPTNLPQHTQHTPLGRSSQQPSSLNEVPDNAVEIYHQHAHRIFPDTSSKSSLSLDGTLDNAAEANYSTVNNGRYRLRGRRNGISKGRSEMPPLAPAPTPPSTTT